MARCLGMDSRSPNHAPAAASRYTGTAQILHWLTLALILAILPLAWVVVSMPRDDPGRAGLFVLHRSFGLTVLVLIVVRLAWRAGHPPPPLPRGSSRVVEWIGRATHWLMYAVLLLMPVSGYLQSGNGHPVSYFGLLGIPGFPRSAAIDDAASTAHNLGQWALYALVALHVLATVWHVAVRRDGLLGRMLPAQRNQA